MGSPVSRPSTVFFQSVITGKPSTQTERVAVSAPVMSVQAATLPRFL